MTRTCGGVCLCSILGVAVDQCDAVARATASLSMGGVGLRSAARTCVPAFWASWADSLAMIRERHPGVASMIVDVLETGPTTPTLQAVAQSDVSVRGVQGVEPPNWQALSHVHHLLRDPGITRRGWQHEAASRLEQHHREVDILPSKAMLRSQSGPGAGVALCSSFL